LITLSPNPLHIDVPKTSASVREVPLAACTLDAMAAHFAEFPVRTVSMEDRRDANRHTARDVSLIFTSVRGNPIGRGSWSTILRPAARAADIPESEGLHALRHFYASALIHRGVSPKVVQKRLGHEKVSMTLDTYSHLWPDSEDDTRDAIQAILGPAADSLRTRIG
jgi:integrase